jgi:hypothetical protein
MTSHIPLLLIILGTFVLGAGCVQNQNGSQVISPVQEQITVVTTPTQIEPTPWITPVQSTTTTVHQTAHPIQTTLPTQIPQPFVTPVPTRTQDPTVTFRDHILLTLDNLQVGKDGILKAHQRGDVVRVRDTAREFEQTLQRKDVLAGMPSKMDYVRVNYYEYADRAGQFAQSFEEGASRWLANDKSSANSFFDAGIIASERADIADKRIRTFLKDHVQEV